MSEEPHCPLCDTPVQDLAEVLGRQHFVKFHCPHCSQLIAVELHIGYVLSEVRKDTETGTLL